MDRGLSFNDHGLSGINGVSNNVVVVLK